MLNEDVIRDREKFRGMVPGICLKYNVPGVEIPDLWALRSFALRVGDRPDGLFISMLGKAERWNRPSSADWKEADADRLGEEPEEEEKEKPLNLQPYRPLTASEMDAKMRRMRNYNPTPKRERGMTLAEYLELERGTKALPPPSA